VTTLIDKIKERGYWLVRVRPDAYEPDRVEKLADLERAVRESAVSLRGWDFPHYDYKQPPARSQEGVQQELDWEHFVEMWRATRSGQFVSLSAFPEDWRDQSGLWPPGPNWSPSAVLSVESTVFRFLEIYEFAARWTGALSLESSVVVSMSIHGLAHRQLQLGPRRIGLSRPRVSTSDEWSSEARYSPAELVAQSADLAIAPAISLFELFGFDISAETVRDMQKEIAR